MADLDTLLARAAPDRLRARSDGTRWTNGQLLFHMLVFDRRRMGALCDRTVAALVRRLESEPEERLHRGMPFPTTWDPYFRPFMTLAEVYAYPVLHFEHHRQQLTLGP